jgi:hypothetical protein
MLFWPQKTIVSSMLPLCFHQKCIEWNLADIHLPCSEPKSIDNAHLVSMLQKCLFFSAQMQLPNQYSTSMPPLKMEPGLSPPFPSTPLGLRCTHLYFYLRFAQRFSTDSYPVDEEAFPESDISSHGEKTWTTFDFL